MLFRSVQMNMILIKTLINSFIPNANIIEARNGREAVDLYTTATPDLVIMDVQMPEMDGLEATREIRKTESLTGKRVPLIALTAAASDEDEKRCRDAGMDDFLTKPIEQLKLQKIVNRFLKISTSEPLNESRDHSLHFNREEMMKRVDNNRELLEEMLVTLEGEMEETLKLLKIATLERKDDSIKYNIHKIKGISLNMSFGRLTDIVRNHESSLRYDYDKIYNQINDEWQIIAKLLKN